MKESPHNGSKRLEQENRTTLFSRTPVGLIADTNPVGVITQKQLLKR